MTAYFDTSAIVPLLIDEASSLQCEGAWNDADEIATSTLAFVEVHTVLAQARRSRRLTPAAHEGALESFERLWEEITPITPSDEIIRSAALLGTIHALRGYDAVHCATALAAASDDYVAVSGDRDLLRAWSELGIATIDTAG